MAGWVLVPCLVTLRAEINVLCPNRDYASDGTIGDAAHQAEVSDHNDDEVGNVPVHDADSKHEVHALDVDDDLREPGVTMQDIVDLVVQRHANGLDDRLTYVIYNRRIWSASRGWTGRAYTGASAHTEHAHFSASYTSGREADTSPFGILEDIVTKADRDDIVNRTAAKVLAGLAAAPIGDGRTLGGSVKALVTPSSESGAVPNIITREVGPLLDAAVAEIKEAVVPAG